MKDKIYVIHGESDILIGYTTNEADAKEFCDHHDSTWYEVCHHFRLAKTIKQGDTSCSIEEVRTCPGIWDEYDLKAGKVICQREVTLDGHVIERPSGEDVTDAFTNIDDSIARDFKWVLVTKY